MTNIEKDSVLGVKKHRLTAIAFVPAKKSNSELVLCRCECGETTTCSISLFLSGKRRSCGCMFGKHNKRTRAHYSWQSMISRCYNKNKDNYEHYGGRGISVYQPWRDSVNNFIADMGQPLAGQSLDRIDVNGNYEPSNCRWADHETQCRNRRSNKILTREGVSRPMCEWAEIAGISKKLMKERIRSGWSIEKAMDTPVEVRYSSALNYGRL